MTDFRTLTPNLMVRNMTDTIAFYKNVLGFEIKISYPEWAYLKKGNAELMFQPYTSLQKEFPELNKNVAGGALTIFIQLDNVKELYDSIADKSIIIRPFGVTAYNGANEFVIQDLNGFVLHFSDVLIT